MMRWIVGSSLKLRLVVVALAVAVMYVGVMQMRAAPVDVLPEFGPPTVEIQTEALGLSAAEVEQLITAPMEQNLLNGVAWLDDIQSESLTGLSRITLIFEPGTDLFRARQVVQERLTQGRDLPKVSKPPVMIQPLSSSNRLMMIRLSSTQLTPIEMSVIARWTIKPRLMGVPGVANVAIWGQRERQLQVQVDPARLKERGVSLDQIIETTGNALWVSPLTFLEASSPGAGGFIDTPNQRLGIQHLLPINTPEDLAKVVIEGCTGGKPTASRHVDENCPPAPQGRPLVVIGDVATVVEDHQPLIGDAVSDDGQGLLLVIEKFPEANTLDVTRGVEDALDGLGPGLAGIQTDTTIFRPANFIDTALDNLGQALLIGFILVVLVLGTFFFDWRSVLIGAIAIPLSLVAAGLVLALRGATFNMVILAGLVVALGVIVDDAIMTIENIGRRLRQHRQEGSDKSPAAIILEAVLEVRSPLISATLIVLIAAMPVFYYADLEIFGNATGSFFGPLALSYALAVLASLVVALTVTPVLALLLMSNEPLQRRQSPLVHRLQRGYATALARIVHRPSWIYAVAVAVVVVGLAVMPQLTRSQAMIPSFEERDLLIQWTGAPGTSRTEMSRITGQVSGELRTIPGVRNVGAHVGRAVTGDQSTDVNGGELWVSIDSGADYDRTVSAVREVVDGYPGLDNSVLTYTEQKLAEERKETGDSVVVRIYGQDQEVLRSKAEEVRQLVVGVDGVAEGLIDLTAEQPQIEVQVDLAAAQQYGLKPGNVRRAAAALLSGIEVGSLFEEQKVFEVMVVGVPEVRSNLTTIQDLLIDTPTGGQVRLGDVASVRVAPNLDVIKHDAVSRYIDVTANVRGRDLGAVADDLEQVVQGVAFPLEAHAVVLGDYADRQADERRLLGFALAAALGVFLLLQVSFGSWRLATLAFLALPATLVGGVLAAYAGNGALSIGSLLGFLTVLAIAARNGIVMISHLQRLEQEEGEPFGPGLVLRGARDRLAPILMTALATGLALVPLVVAGNRAGHEIVRPMAVVILGGLVTSTLLNLFLVPSLYLRFAASAPPRTAAAPMPISPAHSPAD
ncbi:MAG: hypothetical protein QOF73_341 [Thermomicrobiales bacterium]|nr:hypothetical protein [Thermomicrobiales bacterium]